MPDWTTMVAVLSETSRGTENGSGNRPTAGGLPVPLASLETRILLKSLSAQWSQGVAALLRQRPTYWPIISKIFSQAAGVGAIKDVIPRRPSHLRQTTNTPVWSEQ
jgi:hypothetical protein